MTDVKFNIQQTGPGYYDGVTEAIRRQSPEFLGGLEYQEGKSTWGVGLYNPTLGVSLLLDPKDLNGWAPFLVSNVNAKDKTAIGKFGVATVGKYAREDGNVLFTLGEANGGGSGVVYYAVINRRLYIGVITKSRIRKGFGETTEAPRGYADLKKMADDILVQIESHSEAADREAKEETFHLEDLKSVPIRYSNGEPAKADQNGGVFYCLPGTGLGYNKLRWPAEVLTKDPKHKGVYIPDVTHPAVKAATEGGDQGDKTDLYFVPWYNAFDPNAIPGKELIPNPAFESLGAAGSFQLMAGLARSEGFEFLGPDEE